MPSEAKKKDLWKRQEENLRRLIKAGKELTEATT